MNLDFSNDNYRFNARVACIIYNQERTRVLLFKVNNESDFYMLPGGRIEFNEDSKTAISREIREELNFELEYNLCSIQENFVVKNNVNIMQYCFCYKAVYNGIITNKSFENLDNNSQTFYWIDIKDIDKYKILPLSTKNLIVNQSNNIKHIIEK